MGAVCFFGTIYWIYNSVTYYGHMNIALTLCLILLLSLYLGLYAGVFGILFLKTLRATRFPALLLAPVFWVTLEFARSYLLTGFPWSSIGYSQFRFLYAIQIADITGIYGISFLVVAANGAFADIFITKKRRIEMPLFPTAWTIGGYMVYALLIVFAFSYGYWRLHQHRPGHSVKISIIQGDIEQDKKWDIAYQDKVIRTYKDLTLKAAASSPSLIIWPETSLPFYFGYDPGRSKDLVAFQRSLNSYLLFGSVLVKSPPANDRTALLSNSAVLLDKEGNISYSYDKIHLVPFGEYVPLRRLFFPLDKLVAGIGDYVPGDRIIKADTPFGSFGAFICYEIAFPGLVRKFYSKGGDFMLNITNDAWFGNTAGPYQNFDMAVFRAIENRKPLLRAANSGISGYIDSNGRTIKTLPLFRRAYLNVDIKTDQSRSFYSKYGDIFSYICIVTALLVLI